MANSGAVDKEMSCLAGGDAIKGIGKTFAPLRFAGAGNITVPIALQPARNGFQLELGRGHSTGDRPFEPGWALALPTLSRKTSKSATRDDEEADVVTLGCAEDLVPVSDTFLGQVTRCLSAEAASLVLDKCHLRELPQF